MIRIQRRRTKGWRMPEGAVYVGRPTKWGNPYRRSEYVEWFDAVQIPALMVSDFRHGAIERRFVGDLPDYPSVEDIRKELGHATALVCWCPESAPCHADVLLELLAQVLA